MQTIKDSKLFNNLAKEFNIGIPNKLLDIHTYKEIENFKEFEYIYCISYEMLIRTDEYNSLLHQYDNLMEPTNKILPNGKVAQLDELITQMNQLGLNQNSFIGFDCDDGNVFEKIKQYDEITKSPWNVRTLDKFILHPAAGFENALDKMISFYYEKKELYVLESDTKNYIKTNIHPRATLGIDDQVFILCADSDSSEETVRYKSLADTIYLKELDKDFLLTLKENRNKNLLNQIKSDYKVSNNFWYKYTLNDVSQGLNRLIAFYINNGKIQRFKKNSTSSSFDKSDQITSREVFYNLENFSIPCINHLAAIDNGDRVQISKNMPLKILESSFLSTLEFFDLKEGYIETEPMYSRPKLLFTEARLINLPINLNLSKEDLLFYISQIKDDYDDNKDIVKSEIEYILDLTLESDSVEMPTNIKYVEKKSTTKQLLPSGRRKFKQSLASAFYIYDLYKFFKPLFDEKIQKIQNEIELTIRRRKEEAKSGGGTVVIDYTEIDEIKKNGKARLDKMNIMVEIGYFVEELSAEQIKFYLTTMKEFIHGVNLKDECHIFKKDYNPKKVEKTEPKYKSLIIGDSYITTSNRADLDKELID